MKTEKILAVPTKCLWDHVAYIERGLIADGMDQLAAVVSRCGVFVERAAAETNPAYKQIIPYAIIRNGESFLLLERKTAQSEQRLHHKLSVGVGGHINLSEGHLDGDPIHDGLTREINEELYIPAYTSRVVGLINDDTTDVGRVHLGVLFEIVSGSPEVRVRETRKMRGSWALIGTLKDNYERLESWSQIVYDSHLRPQALGACTIQQHDAQ